MPCKECENGKWRWGESGECMYESKEDCEIANQDAYLEETLKPKADDIVIDHQFDFNEEQMKELHENGRLIVEVEDKESGDEMKILFTYEKDGDEIDGEYISAKSKLNEKGYSNAASLIEDDKVDKAPKGWSFTSEDGNKLLGEDGDDWENYAKWFLLEDEEASENTKERYKFPFGKNGKVYRSALSAIRQRAGQFEYEDVFEAAGKLIEMIEGEEAKLDEAYSALTRAMLDDELDAYIDKLTDSIKKI
jgi:hypothetical protein